MSRNSLLVSVVLTLHCFWMYCSFEGIDQQKVRVSVNRAFHDCQTLGVVKSLAPLVNCDLPPALKADLTTLYVPFGAPDISFSPPVVVSPATPASHSVPAVPEAVKTRADSPITIEASVGEKRPRVQDVIPEVSTPRSVTPIELPA